MFKVIVDSWADWFNSKYKWFAIIDHASLFLSLLFRQFLPVALMIKVAKRKTVLKTNSPARKRTGAPSLSLLPVSYFPCVHAGAHHALFEFILLFLNEFILLFLNEVMSVLLIRELEFEITSKTNTLAVFHSLRSFWLKPILPIHPFIHWLLFHYYL